MTDPDPDATQRAVDALARVVDVWMRRRGVVSTEVARRPGGGVGIRVTVERLLPAHEVPAGELFPDELDGVPVDVVEGHPPTPESRHRGV